MKCPQKEKMLTGALRRRLGTQRINANVNDVILPATGQGISASVLGPRITPARPAPTAE